MNEVNRVTIATDQLPWQQEDCKNRIATLATTTRTTEWLPWQQQDGQHNGYHGNNKMDNRMATMATTRWTTEWLQWQQ